MERIKYWNHKPYSLTLWDTHKTDYRGCTNLRYRFRHNGKVIFEGEDFHGSPMHADDSLATVASLLTFLSLRPGDTDPEYFEAYTPDQLAWCQQHGEDLSFIAMQLEERVRKRRG